MSKYWIIGLFWSTSLWGQDGLQFSNLSVMDGLSQATILSLEQDRMGFIWVGTADGLNRYDGYEFMTFRHDPDNPHGISDNEIMALHDSGNHLWIGNANGLDRFDKSSNQCAHFSNDPTQGNLSDNYVTSIFEDDLGRVWIGTANGLNMYNEDGDFKTTLPSNFGFDLHANIIREVTSTGPQDYYLATDGGLLHFDPTQNKVKAVYLDDFTSAAAQKISVVFKDQQNYLWVGSPEGLLKLDKNHKVLAHYHKNASLAFKLSDNQVNDMVQTKAGSIWVGTGNGLNSIEPQVVTHYLSDSQNPYSLSNNFIHTIMEDSQGILWVGTDSGLNQFNPMAYQFNSSKVTKSQDNDLINNKTWAILEEPSGEVWVGTQAGLYHTRRQHGELPPFEKADGVLAPLAETCIKAIIKDSLQAYWIGTEQGLYRYAGDHLDKIISGDGNKNLTDNYINVLIAHNDLVWAGTPNGLNSINLKTHEVRQFKFAQTGKNSLSRNAIRALHMTSDRMLWIGTEGGLIRLNPQDESYIFFEAGPLENNLMHDFVRSIYEDSSGRLWIGTSGGLHQLDREHGNFEKYHLKQGLPNSVIYCILEDDKQNLWLSTNKGLAQFNPQSRQFTNYDVQDGLQNNEFNSNAGFKNLQGELYFGGINGFNIFHPNDIKMWSSAPRVVFTGFEILNKNVDVGENYPLRRSINSSDTIYLNFSHYNFTFHFAGLNFTNPNKSEYSYKLEGFDKDWNEVGSRRFATYTNIPGGNYLFKVRSRVNRPDWPETYTSIYIQVAQPFWQNKGLQLLGVAFLILLGYLFYRWRMLNVRKKSEVLEDQVKLRTEKISKQKEEIEKAYEELNRTLSKLKQAQTQLVQSEKMATLGQLTAGIAHEINNPVNFIYSGIAGLEKNLKALLDVASRYGSIDNTEEFETQIATIRNIKKKLDYDEVISDVNDLMQSIKEGAERTAGIVKGLQLYSRNDHEVMTMCDLHSGLEATLTILGHQIHHGVTINKHFDATLPGAACNQSRINQVFTNLLSNSLQAIGERRGVIDITTSCKDGIITISIEDNGPGIPPKILDKIFDPFFTTKDVGGGTGLGLSISKGIIDEHGGSLDIQNLAHGGCRAIISLPVEQPMK